MPSETVPSDRGSAPSAPARRERIDVAHIMRQVRNEARARESEISRRIEFARQQLESQFPRVFDDSLRTRVQELSRLFSQYYDRTARYLSEQEPNLANIQRTLAEVNRLVADPSPPRGAYDRWWNPRYWVKRFLVPIRRFVLRRQYEVNALMRDTLAYLVNHSSHIASLRAELEVNVQIFQALEGLIEHLDGALRYFHEWPRLSLLHVAEYMDELHDQAAERQTQALAAFREDIQKMLNHLDGDWKIRLTELSRQISGLAPGKAAAVAGFDYHAFAEMLRGSPDTLRRRQACYLKYLTGQGPVLDCGCGRGELLELLRDNGIAAYGVDLDERMIHVCHEKGLDARCEDAITHLAELPDSSLGAVVALQVIEHLDFADLYRFLLLSIKKLRPNGIAIFETVNPTCLTTFSGAFYADPTHVRPIHPEAARRLLELVGFSEVQIDYQSPVDEAERLKSIENDVPVDSNVRRIMETINENIQKINSLLYNYADYAVIGRKSG
ncbi:MAG: methyltransferase domain-containing protein [Candidatus Sumerlaeia bacterium]|nr:methyltransferase domain-containing protein [Candidatus Sumerlaeia bacterium]